MPYIMIENRHKYDDEVDKLVECLRLSKWRAGEVTYVVFRIVGAWFKNKPGYQTICEIRGMLAGVLSEFDRRMAFNYEDIKLKENGDVRL